MRRSSPAVSSVEEFNDRLRLIIRSHPESSDSAAAMKAAYSLCEQATPWPGTRDELEASLTEFLSQIGVPPDRQRVEILLLSPTH